MTSSGSAPVAFDLDVAFLKDVEEADLNLSRQVRQLVDREDAPVRPRQQAVVHRRLIGELQAGPRRLDWIEIADHVGDRHVRGCQLLDVAGIPSQPADGEAVALLPHPRPAHGAERCERIVVNLASRNDGNRVIEKFGQRAKDAALRLAAQAEEDEVVPGQNRVDDLRDDGLFVSDDAGKERGLRAEPCDQVLPDLVLHWPALDAARGDVVSKLPEG